MAEGGVKLHYGRYNNEKTHTEVDGDVFKFLGANSATGIIKLLEPMSPLYNYFELEILDKGREASIGIGVGERGYPMGRMPGWNRNSIGYHADDGRLYHERGMGRAFGPTCGDGDRMGCGISFDTGSLGFVDVYFTKNGKQVGENVRVKRPMYGFYPLVGLHSRGEQVRYLGHWRRRGDGSGEPMDDDSSPASIWLRGNAVRFLDDGLTVEYDGYGGDGQDVGIAQWRYPLDRTNHYFEMEILGTGSKGALALGLAKTSYPLHRHPGWNEGAVGYHADDGKLFKEKGYGEQFGPTCNEGDRMGCGIRFPLDSVGEGGMMSDSDSAEEEGEEEEDGVGFGGLGIFSDWSYSDDSMDDFGDEFGLPPQLALRRMAMEALKKKDRRGAAKKRSGQKCLVYFTKNGEEVGETECIVPRGGFYPVVAMLSVGEKLRVNFHPFSG